MKLANKTQLDFVIDKLTNSIENTSTGEVFDTVVVQVTTKDLNRIAKSDWQFDWAKEIKDKTKEVQIDNCKQSYNYSGPFKYRRQARSHFHAPA